MVVTCSHCGTKFTLGPAKPGAPSKGKFRCSKCGETTLVDLSTPLTETVGAPGSTPAPKPAFDPNSTQVNEYSGLELPKDKNITISGIGGPAKGIKHPMTKPRVTVGRLGGGADIEIDDPEISRKHCKVEAKQDIVKLIDLKSTNGTFVNDERVPQAELEHLSEFRVGSSLLLVTIMQKQD
jgi:predicted Zn finger-like uncharacterized protein